MAQLMNAARIAVLMNDRWNEKRVVDSLQAAGLSVECVPNALGLMSLLERQQADLVVVEDSHGGLDACLASLRFRGLAGVPTIALGQGSMQQIIHALSHGASDYLCLADAGEVLANRVLARIALSRRQPLQRATLQLGELTLDAASRVLGGPHGEFTLTSREFELASVLFEHAGEVVNLHLLSQRVWGRDASLAKRTIEQHISRLRQKLCRAVGGAGRVQLQAIHSIGYRLTHACALDARVMPDVVALPTAA